MSDTLSPLQKSGLAALHQKTVLIDEELENMKADVHALSTDVDDLFKKQERLEKGLRSVAKEQVANSDDDAEVRKSLNLLENALAKQDQELVKLGVWLYTMFGGSCVLVLWTIIEHLLK